ncbi:MAG: Ku protein [Bacteroidetes bacterium]|nr:Ku protein [Bacteroidota bacterium]HET6243036.1 Ku protein [Bacteroidia bacterium]
MRAIWSGAISFGLVNIPVKVYSATESVKLDFDMLDKNDLSPIRYARISTGSDKEIPYQDIVKGYKWDDRYIIVENEDFEKASPEKTKTIEIVDFVDESEIDSILYEKPYYLEPDKTAQRPYALLRQALQKSKKVGIALFVFRNKQHIGVVKPSGDVVVLNQIRFTDQIRSTEELNLPMDKLSKGKELEMALALIEQSSSEFNPQKYKDEYSRALLEMIEKKAKGKPIKAGKAKQPKPTDNNQLMNMLKASLAKRKKERSQQKQIKK